jgi:rhodanese-related sulfurtransferase
MIEQIDAAALSQRRQSSADALAGAVLLDVREPWEFEIARIGDSINVPMSTLGNRVDEVLALQDASAAPLVVICHHGSRSMNCAQFLANQGLGPLINLSGGIDAWSQRVDPSVPRY